MADVAAKWGIDTKLSKSGIPLLQSLAVINEWWAERRAPTADGGWPTVVPAVLAADTAPTAALRGRPSTGGMDREAGSISLRESSHGDLGA